MNGPETPAWRRLAADDLPALRAFLLRHEDYAAGFTARILQGGELRLPGIASGGLFGLAGAEGLRGAVLRTQSGTVFPIFESAPAPDQAERFSRFFRGGNLTCILGAARHVQAFEDILDLAPRVRVAYRSLYRPRDEEKALDLRPPVPGARARRAGPEDLERIFPLHAAYEREEVMTEIHVFDPAASRVSLRHFLETETVVVAEAEGRAAATVRTNARGFRTWQIGGVYVLPDFRGRGWGRYVVGSMLEAALEAGKSVGLFVKEKNDAARGLYLSLGFRDVGAYRVDYL